MKGLRIWWNWQTRYFEVVVPQGVQVQVLLSAPTFYEDLQTSRPVNCLTFWDVIVVPGWFEGKGDPAPAFIGWMFVIFAGDEILQAACPHAASKTFLDGLLRAQGRSRRPKLWGLFNIRLQVCNRSSLPWVHRDTPDRP